MTLFDPTNTTLEMKVFGRMIFCLFYLLLNSFLSSCFTAADVMRDLERELLPKLNGLRAMSIGARVR